MSRTSLFSGWRTRTGTCIAGINQHHTIQSTYGCLRQISTCTCKDEHYTNIPYEIEDLVKTNSEIHKHVDNDVVHSSVCSPSLM